MKTSDLDECVLCCKEITLYAIGVCDHPVCYECSTRMRVLCESNECPICRCSIPVIIYTYERYPYATLKDKYTLFDEKYQIKFESAEARNAFNLLLENRCKECGEVFYTFEKLKEHVRRIHSFHYCDLCSDNLKIFPFEKKYYSRKDLARHMRLGDPDLTSHRGHPQCQFCDTRYIDLDDLFRHLRKEHYFCHFCDADGKNEFYDDYDYLRVHFRQHHFLCEEEHCAEELFTSAFRTEIDMKAHIALNHTKNKSKAEARQARMLDLEFSYVPHSRSSGNSSPRSARYRKKAPDESVRDSKVEQQDVEDIDTRSTLQFPYLSEGGESVQNQSGCASTNLNLQSYNKNAQPSKMKTPSSVEDFPALVPAPSSNSSSSSSSNVTSNKNYSSISKQKLSSRTNLPNQQPSKFSSKNTESSSDSKPSGPSWVLNKKSTCFDEEFPSLGGKKLYQAKCKTAENVPVSSSSSSMNNIASASASQLNGADKFVVIKGKSKKKKSKNLVDDISDDKDVKTQEFLQNKYNILNEEKDFKQNMMRSAPPKINNTYVDSWFQPPSFGKDDFPPLGPSESVRPPPGFNVLKKKPPPGFSEASTNSDSGLSNITLSSIAQKIAVPNKNDEIKQAPVSSEFYKKPPNFDLRNSELIRQIQKLTNTPESFSEFKCLSGKFRQSEIPADEYYTKCLNIFGEKKLSDIFPELLALLPDINKQQELLHIDKKYQNRQINSGAIPKKALGNSNLSFCETCYQVLVNTDYQSHILHHQSQL